MKRGTFKQKSYAEKLDKIKTKTVKKTTKKVKKKTSNVSLLKKKLWQACREFALKKYQSKDGKYYCFTSGKEIEGSNRQLGHLIPSAVGGILCRYHPYNLRWQSYFENINLGGNGSEFYIRLVNIEGQDYADRLFALKYKTGKGDILFYEQMIALYEQGDENKIVEFLEMIAQ